MCELTWNDPKIIFVYRLKEMEERLLAMERKMNKEDGAGVNISSIIVYHYQI